MLQVPKSHLGAPEPFWVSILLLNLHDLQHPAIYKAVLATERKKYTISQDSPIPYTISQDSPIPASSGFTFSSPYLRVMSATTLSCGTNVALDCSDS